MLWALVSAMPEGCYPILCILEGPSAGFLSVSKYRIRMSMPVASTMAAALRHSRLRLPILLQPLIQEAHGDHVIAEQQ